MTKNKLQNIDKTSEQGNQVDVFVMPEPRQRDKNDIAKTGRTILAIVQHWYTKNKRFAVLKSVGEFDCNYRIADDNSELSYDWNVIAWDYLPKI